MFVTSAGYTGNLGGVAGADAICQTHAQAAGLVGTFRARISTVASPAASRLVHYSGPYYRRSPTGPFVVAVNWADLTDGAISAAIATDEFGVSAGSSTYAWTGTWTNGTPYSTSCTNWTDSAMTSSGHVGHTSAGNASWTASFDALCNTARRLYCVQQTNTPSG
jgi:Protein of unknown function (DUF1554)